MWAKETPYRPRNGAGGYIVCLGLNNIFYGQPEFPDIRFSLPLLPFFGNNSLRSSDPLRNLSEKNNNGQ